MTVPQCSRAPRMRAAGTRRARVDLQPEEIPDLRAGDQDRDAVGEADDDRPRQELHRGAHAGDAEDDQHHAAIIVHMNRPLTP